jgi:glycosyltransferase involved in cell wall biosynthesis
MLRRVGVIGSRAGAIPEILGEGQYGLLFQAGDVAGLIEAIKFAQREQAYMAEMVERAFEYAQRTFGVETMVKQILKVYEKMR